MRYISLLSLIFSFNLLADNIEGPIIKGHDDAAKVCPARCELNGMEWNLHWNNNLPRPGVSICTCIPIPEVLSVEAGPISGDAHALKRCPVVCEEVGRVPTGHWYTTEPGKMSKCDCAIKKTEEEKEVIEPKEITDPEEIKKKEEEVKKRRRLSPRDKIRVIKPGITIK